MAGIDAVRARAHPHGISIARAHRAADASLAFVQRLIHPVKRILCAQQIRGIARFQHKLRRKRHTLADAQPVNAP